jgi:hypothetical protein
MKAIFEVNLWGLLRVTQAFAPLIVEQKWAVVNRSFLGVEEAGLV